MDSELGIAFRESSSLCRFFYPPSTTSLIRAPATLANDLGELLVIAFVSVLCGTVSCAEMAAFARA